MVKYELMKYCFANMFSWHAMNWRNPASLNWVCDCLLQKYLSLQLFPPNPTRQTAVTSHLDAFRSHRISLAAECTCQISAPSAHVPVPKSPVWPQPCWLLVQNQNGQYWRVAPPNLAFGHGLALLFGLVYGCMAFVAWSQLKSCSGVASFGAVLQLCAVSIPGSQRSCSLQFLSSITVTDNYYFRSDYLVNVTHICFYIPSKELKTSARQWLRRQVQWSASAGTWGFCKERFCFTNKIRDKFYKSLKR